MDRDDTVQVVGRRADGTEEVIGTTPMPPKMKARELVREAFGQWTDEDGSEADMAMFCCEQLITYMGRTQFAITPRQPAEALPLIAEMQRLRTENEQLKAAATAAQQEPVAEVLWFDPALYPEQPKTAHKIIDAGMAWMDSAPIGTKLYAAPVAAATAAQRDNSVSLPQNAAHAELLAKAGIAWLQQHAPGRLVAGTPAAQSSRWRYVKTGATYTEVGRGLLKDEVGGLGWQDAVIYRSEADGAIYVRPADQFNDRFERIGPATATKGAAS